MQNWVRMGAMVLAAGCVSAAAQGIYKWVDPHGHVHYGDHPGPGSAEPMTIHTAPPADPGLDQRNALRQRLLDAFAHEREEKSRQAAREQAARKRQERRCAAAKSQLTALEQNGRVYTKDAKGGRRYLSDEQRQAQLANTRRAVAKWCR